MSRPEIVRFSVPAIITFYGKFNLRNLSVLVVGHICF